jgi:hypothetical protein
VSDGQHRLVFVCGLHRSGTTLLARILGEHPEISGFADTGAPEDEGQHLQQVYPPAKVYGGPGRFGFDERAHLTEASPLVGPGSRERLWDAWKPHWNLSKPLVVEKSPPNLLKTRFLQEVFPEASFVVLARHPVAVSLATAKWRQTRRYDRLVQHWLRCHELFEADRPHLERVHVLLYEDLVRDPAATLAGVLRFLGLAGDPPSTDLDPSSNRRYFERWRQLAKGGLFWRAYFPLLTAHYEGRVRRFGYSLRDLDRAEGWL